MNIPPTQTIFLLRSVLDIKSKFFYILIAYCIFKGGSKLFFLLFLSFFTFWLFRMKKQIPGQILEFQKFSKNFSEYIKFQYNSRIQGYLF